MAALAQWIAPNRREPTFDCTTAAPHRRVALTQRVERAQPDLAKPFTLDQEPLVVPVGEEVVGEERIVEVLLGKLACHAEQTVGLGACLVQIDTDSRREADPRVNDLDERMTAPSEFP